MFIPFREKKEYLIQNLGNELLCIFRFGDSALSSITVTFWYNIT